MGDTVVNSEALIGLLGQNAVEYAELMHEISNHPEMTDKEKTTYYALDQDPVDNYFFTVK